MGLLRRSVRKLRRSGVKDFLLVATERLKKSFFKLQSKHPLSAGGQKLSFVYADAESRFAVDYFQRNELHTLQHFMCVIDEDDVVLDVGANVGIYACFAAAAGADVYAIEPHPPNVALLEQNVELNEVAVTVLELGLGSESDSVSLSDSSSSVSGGIAVVPDSHGATQIVRGDELLDTGKIAPPTVIKIDVEGAEGDVIRGLDTFLRSSKNTRVFLELHTGSGDGNSVRDFGMEPQEVKTMLKGLGYELETVVDRGEEEHIFARPV